MIRYRVKKCRPGRCICSTNGRPWRVERIRGLERSIMSSWPGQAAALDAALELAGLARPMPQEMPC